VTPDEVARAVAAASPPGGGQVDAVQIIALGPDCADITVRVGGEWFKAVLERAVWGDVRPGELRWGCGALDGTPPAGGADRGGAGG
jgi:hypothetical protein